MRIKHIALVVLMSLLLTLLAACGGTAAAPAEAPTAAPAATAAPAEAPTAASARATSAPAEAPTAAGAATAAPAAAGGGKTYILVPKNLGNPYFDTANKGAQEAAKELGVTVTYQGPATADATQQIQLINSLIAQKVSGLAISADDSDALAPVGKTAMGQKIPVVSWDSSVAASGRNVHVNQANAE